ncbi:MAG: hypothetical protein WAX85_01905 [Minisyncoccia bacterium]
MDDLEEKDESVIEEDVEDLDDELVPGKKKGKKLPVEDDSLDTLAEEEEEVLPEDSFDDIDLW